MCIEGIYEEKQKNHCCSGNWKHQCKTESKIRKQEQSSRYYTEMDNIVELQWQSSLQKQLTVWELSGEKNISAGLRRCGEKCDLVRCFWKSSNIWENDKIFNKAIQKTLNIIIKKRINNTLWSSPVFTVTIQYLVYLNGPKLVEFNGPIF